jgi:hypothetical protein
LNGAKCKHLEHAAVIWRGEVDVKNGTATNEVTMEQAKLVTTDC